MRYGVALAALASVGCTGIEIADAASNEDSGPMVVEDASPAAGMDAGPIATLDSGPPIDADSGPPIDIDSEPPIGIDSGPAGCMTGVFGVSNFGSACLGG